MTHMQQRWMMWSLGGLISGLSLLSLVGMGIGIVGLFSHMRAWPAWVDHVIWMSFGAVCLLAPDLHWGD
ncbi:protein of unknown function [Candidatus Hydrogenisulfobacillus filiaventi]|uniref:Uncharacterized protein n=1 Tax=Candidatus Hydrogenisulfobacillus filiaventi TaxID=2707344 RepID=A0A6F8ZIL9_9FIRM|nr:protein of unknown function [Candidatus Hydrogenisulfobacillus filiaventi]